MNNAVELFKNNLGLSSYCTKSWLNSVPPQWHEDLLSEARIALWQACITYDPDKGATFSTYAYRVIQNKLQNFFRGNKRDFRNCSIQQPVSEDEKITLEETLSYEYDFEADIMYQKLKEIINDFEITQMKLSGMTQQNIAKVIGTSQVSVSRKLKSERQKIKKLLEVG